MKLSKIILALLVTMAVLTQSHGQVWPIDTPTRPASSDSASIAEQRAQAEAQLAETQRQRAAELAGSRSLAGAEAVRTADRQRMLDILVFQQGEKIKRLDELASLQKVPPPDVAALASVRALGGSPPYSALAVDALRDEHDDLRAKIRELNSDLRVRESEKQSLHEQLRRADEALRQSNDRLARARDNSERASEKESREQEALRKRVGETMLAVIAIDEERLKLQMSHLRTQDAEMEKLVARVLPEQRLSERELEEQRQRMLVSRQRLAADMNRISEGQQGHEREQSGLRARSPSPDSPAGQALARLDKMLAIDAVIIDGLKRLEVLSRVEGEVWEKRYLALAGDDQEHRRLAIASLTKLYQDLGQRKRVSAEQRVAASLEIRDQEIRVANLRPDSPELRGEQEILRLLKESADVHERIELGANRLERQLARWQGDFARPGDASIKGQADKIGEGLLVAWRTLWRYELFAVEDVSLVDGQKVTVSYGVTVGKSVGALLLFVVGYWLFSLLSLSLQRVLIKRFGIDSHLAPVIRRWAMILLAIGLGVFILDLARIPLTVFAFMGGALAIGVGFGTQTIIKNFISGIIILFERKIRVGDIVEAGGVTGHVTAVDLRATTVRGFNGVEALVPNSNFLENQVVNWTYTSQKIRRELCIGIAYGSDAHAAEAILLDAAREHPRVLGLPAAEVYFEDFADSALLMVLVFWVELGPATDARRVASDLRHTIYERLADTGIAIPFPQQDVHLHLAKPWPGGAAATGQG